MKGYEGMWLEFIAAPCIGERYTMPLGLSRSGESWTFRVYRGTGMARLLEDRGATLRFKLMLLSPSDPLFFVESYFHRLEARLEPWSQCPRVDPLLGSWYFCDAMLSGTSRDALAYTCSGGLKLIVEGSKPLAYARSYGCIVELLVLHSKLKAGVTPSFDIVSYAEGLEWCIRRSAPGRSDLAVVAYELLQDIRMLAGKA